MELLKTEFTKYSEKLAKAGNSAKQYDRINVEPDTRKPRLR